MRKLSLLCLLFLFAALPLWAADTSAISGKVLDPSGAAIPKAEVTLTNPATGEIRHAESDANGSFSITELPTGTYSIAVSKTDFVSFHQEKLELQPGQTLTLSVTIKLSSLGQSVTVNANEIPGATPEPTQQQVFDSYESVRVLDRRQMDVAGPVAGAAQIISLAPGANVTGYGNTGATKYTIDINGINQGWGGYGGYTGGGSLGITFDGVPIVDPATGLWQSPTLPQTEMIQNTNVTYGPGDPATRWYTDIGGSVEFTPIQPSAKPHADVSLTYGSYNQKNLEVNLASGLYHGWSFALAAGGGLGDDFRNSPDGFDNPSKDWAVYTKALKTFDKNSFSIGEYYAHSGGYRPQVIPTVANPLITIGNQPGTAIYSQQTTGFYSTLPFDNYNKYDTNEMALIYGRENIQVDDTTTLQNMSWYMHIARLHNRLADVYNIGPQQFEWNDPYTNTIGDELSITKRLTMNTLTVAAYYIHALYNSRNNFYNPADGGSTNMVNVGGQFRSSYFDQDDFAITLQDDIRLSSKINITPGIRYVGFATGYSNGVLQDFLFTPGVVLNTHCPSTLASTPGNVNDQSASCDNRQNRSGVEPSINASAQALSWLTLYGGYDEALKAPQMGGGGGLFQKIDPNTYHLARQHHYQVGFKTHFEGMGVLKNFLFGAVYYHENFAGQEIDYGLANGDEISANGTSVYRGANVFADDDPLPSLHLFANFSYETAKYTNYQVSSSPGNNYNGLPVPYVPTSMMNLGAYYDFKLSRNLAVEPMAAFQFVGSQHIFDNVNGIPSSQTMPSYETLNLGLKIPYKFTEFNLTALNVLNKQYNIYEFISSGGYFGTANVSGAVAPQAFGYVLAYPAAPFTIYGGVTFHF